MKSMLLNVNGEKHTSLNVFQTQRRVSDVARLSPSRGTLRAAGRCPRPPELASPPRLVVTEPFEGELSRCGGFPHSQEERLGPIGFSPVHMKDTLAVFLCVCVCECMCWQLANRNWNSIWKTVFIKNCSTITLQGSWMAKILRLDLIHPSGQPPVESVFNWS